MKKKSRRKKSKGDPGIALVDVHSVVASIAAEEPEMPEDQKNREWWDVLHYRLQVEFLPVPEGDKFNSRGQ